MIKICEICNGKFETKSSTRIYCAIIVVENPQGKIMQQENIKKQYCEEI